MAKLGSFFSDFDSLGLQNTGLLKVKSQLDRVLGFPITDSLSSAIFRHPHKNAIDIAVARSIGFSPITDWFRVTQPKQDVFNFALGGHTQTNKFNFLSNPNQAKIDVTKNLESIFSGVSSRITSYETHLDLTKGIAGIFENKFSIKAPVNLFSPANYQNGNQLNRFDVLSGSIFNNIFTGFNKNEEAVAEAYSEIETLLQDEEFKEDVAEMEATVVAMQIGSASGTEKWYKLPTIHDYLELFLNKILIRKWKLSPGVGYAIIGLIITAGIVAIQFRDVFIEANGDKIWETVSGEKIDKDKVIETVSEQGADSSKMTDVIFNDCTVYLRKSDTTKIVGTFKINAIVSYLKRKGDWCLVEGTGTVKRKNTRANRKKFGKNNMVTETTIRGWVKKINLDMFQRN